MARNITKAELAERVKELEREVSLLRRSFSERNRLDELFLETVGEACYLFDLKGNVMGFNREAQGMLGYEPGELPGLNYKRFTSPETARRLYECFHRIYTTGVPQRMVDYEVIRKDGSRRIHEMSAGLVRDERGDPAGFRVLVRDVTEQRLMKALLEEGERRYRTIFENTGTATIVIAADTTVLLANANFARLVGYSKEEIEGKMSWTVFVHPEDLERMRRYHFMRREAPGSAPTSYEFRLLTRSGDTRHIRVSLAMIPGTGESVASCMDITDLKKAEEEARLSSRRYQDILDSMQEAYYEVDLKGNFTFFNFRAIERLGYTLEELNGMNYRRYMDEENARKVYEAFHGVFLTGEPVTGFAWELKDKSGNPIFVEASISLKRDESGSPVGFRGVVRDITEKRKAEDELRASRQRYRDILESMEEGYFEVNLRGEFVSFNEAAMRMTSLSAEELMGMHYHAYAPPETARRMYETFNTVYRTRRPMRMVDYKVIHKDGSLHDNELTVWPKLDKNGEVVGFHTLVRDVTERKKAEDALRVSEERYRAIFENTGSASILIAEDTTVLLCNSTFAKLTGYSKEEIEGKMSWTVFVHEDDLERMKTHHVQRRKDPSLAPSSYEFRLKTRSGEIRDMLLSVVMIPGTKEGVVSCLDITELKRTAEALKRSEERFRDLARLLPETVFEADKTGRLTFVNDISFATFGYTREDLERGLSLFDMIVPGEREKAAETVARIMAGHHLGLSEYTAMRKDGVTFPVLVHSTPIVQDGRVSGIRGFLIDITEKKNLEPQLMRAQKMEAIGTLAGGIAHDFNNLLMGILGNVSLLLAGVEEGNPAYERLKSMEEYVRRGSELTKQLLGFARGGKYEVKTTDMAGFVQRSAEMFGRTKKDIRMHVKAVEGLHPVEVDRGQMDQVFLNLFVNAWQAMPEGGDIFISLENSVLGEDEVAPHGLRPGRYVKITVTDTGVGMPPEILSRVFEPFFTTKERGRGTGLGLASVYGIVKNHGGFILVDSEKDVGTSFTIYLPASDKTPEKEEKKDEGVEKGSGTVLLVDDEDMILSVGRGMLERLGYTVIAAQGGREGVRLFGENAGKIDLVILDMVMPEFSGRETFEAMRRQDPGVKVLLSSGYSLDGQARQLMDSGCNGFIQKPFTMAELSKKISEILKEDRTQAA